MTSKKLQHFIHQHFFWLLISSYVVAGIMPGFGLWLRGISLGTVWGTRLTLPTVLLGALLFNAGMGSRTGLLKGLKGDLSLLVAGLMANLLLPLAFILGISQVMQLWHNPDEVQNL